jgi:hypothetical protein
MPAARIRSHIAASAEAFSERAMTQMSRIVGGRYVLEEGPRENAKRVSKAFARVVDAAVFKIAKMTDRLILGVLLEIFVGQILRPAQYEALAKKIKCVLRAFGASEEKAITMARSFHNEVLEFSSFFFPGDRNALAMAAKAGASLSSAEINRVAQQSLALYALFLSAFPEMATAERQAVPLVAGLLLHLRGNAATKIVLRRLDSAEGISRVSKDLAALRGTINTFVDTAIGEREITPAVQYRPRDLAMRLEGR